MKKENVLVHCFAGAQRSCATMACYLMKYHNATPEQAIDYIKSQRAVAFFGNVNFVNAIEEFYKKL
jgi:protein-tyrosine phosphatase